MIRAISPLDPEVEELGRKAIGCCIVVHRELGPGLLERIYHRAVRAELKASNIPCECEKPFPVFYRGDEIYVHRVDLIIGGQILLELKAVENLHMVHRAQVLSCLRVTRLRVGLLINFNVAVLASGIQRIAL